jgi:hypothetical protein
MNHREGPVGAASKHREPIRIGHVHEVAVDEQIVQVRVARKLRHAAHRETRDGRARRHVGCARITGDGLVGGRVARVDERRRRVVAARREREKAGLLALSGVSLLLLSESQ